jgi:hypothetical protein
MSDEIEEWLPIAIFEGAYEVSDHGRVRSLERTVTAMYHGRPAQRSLRGRILKPSTNRDGYQRVTLCSNGVSQTWLVHQLVLKAFVGPRAEGMVACHANDIPADNRASNLRWDTPAANVRDQVRNGNHHSARKTHCEHGHEFTPENTHVAPDARRVCRECKRESMRALRERKRLAELKDAA